MEILDVKMPVDDIYLDIMQRAFDKVLHIRLISHKRLLTKLTGYGIHGKPFDWIKDFLSDRT